MLRKLRNNINELVLQATYKAQKKYGFDLCKKLYPLRWDCC